MVAHALLATEGDKSQQAFGVLRSMNKTGVFKCSICFLIVEQMCMKPKHISYLFVLTSFPSFVGKTPHTTK